MTVQRALRMSFALFAIAACESGTAPAVLEVSPRYGLLDIDSVALPVRASVSGADTTFLTSEVVTFRSDGIAGFERQFRTMRAGVQLSTGRTEFGLRYALSGDTVTMDNGVVCVTLPCPRIALVGLVTDSTLRLAPFEAPLRISRYARLPAGSAPP